MATILLSAAGAAVGAGFGGTVLGLSGAVIGRAAGAALGRAIDQRLLGAGSRAVESGRIDRFRLTGASEGAPVARLWGRMRVAGQVIWASDFAEVATQSGGGKGAPRVRVTEYSYSVSLAIALCEGEIARVGRIWADGTEIAREEIALRVYTGSEAQLPDPKIAAVEGAGMAPAYRGIAYVVIEDLALAPYGNRVPQFSFEVVRAAQGPGTEGLPDLARGVRAVALIPGSGEYALATTPVSLREGLGQVRMANVGSAGGRTDFLAAVEALREELPRCGSVSLVVSWFGDDLRCGTCGLQPKVEQAGPEGAPMRWRVSGLNRAQAEPVARREGRPVYGGTPADASVIEAIRELRAGGQEVVVYPFILMEQMPGNGRADPWSGAEEQPVLPWRGRITLSGAPGREGSPDRSAAAEAEVAAFFGSAAPEDFEAAGETVAYRGPQEWSYRRFILHYAHLAKLAGGVEAFCIGSEMRGLTQIRGAGDAFPAVAALRALAADVRAVLGPEVKIGYAADWSEYSGYRTPEGDLRFPLDPLWADAEVDFVGIDNYMPLADWREGEDHADAGWGSVHDLGYLMANVAGGEGFDWHYAGEEHRAAQLRTPITDGDHGEPWVWRVKDIRSWWENPHHERIGGVRQAGATAWEPRSKPVWFTEIGCAAVDKGANEPNRFLDPKSSESALPRYSDGRRDDLMQMQALRAVFAWWDDPAHNPVSEVYGGPMVDMDRAHVWAWDARPFPQFPNDRARWADGENWARGHWISGRAAAQPLAAVVAEICASAGLHDVDVSGLHGVVRGYAAAEGGTARAALQPLMLAYGFDAVERDGRVVLVMRGGRVRGRIGPEHLAAAEEGGALETVRAPEAEAPGRVRLAYVEAEGDFEARAVEAAFPGEAEAGIAQSEIVLALTRSEAQGVAERWLAEARVARDGARFALPPSMSALGPGDVVRLETAEGARRYRIDRLEQAGALTLEAVRVEPGVYRASDEAEERVAPRAFAPPAPVFPLFLDLPLMTGEEVPHAPHLAVTATPWPGSVAVYASASGDGYALEGVSPARAVMGRTEGPLFRARPGLWDRGAALRVRVEGGTLASAEPGEVLNGANLMAVGDGARWELVQFAVAEPVEAGLYELRMLLRGQAGTEADAPEVWPAGSYVVRIDRALRQLGLPAAARGLARHYRIGPAQRGYDDPSYVHEVRAFEGIGLRPYAPCHLRAVREAGGLRVVWVRRSRAGDDQWGAGDAPLGEAFERYLVRVTQDGAIRREAVAEAPGWTYAAAAQAADGVAGAFAVEVAQISEAFGPGPFARIEVDG